MLKQGSLESGVDHFGLVLGDLPLQFGDPLGGNLFEIELAGTGFQDQTMIAGSVTIVEPDDDASQWNEHR